jgi:hypothetical protein
MSNAHDQGNASVLTATDSLARLRPYYEGEALDFMRVLLNAISPTEANLALEVLRTSLPEKVILTACNLREVLRSLPTSPFSMRVDEDTFAKAAGFDRDVAVMCRKLDDGLVLCLTTAGNLVLDMIVKDEHNKYFWNDVPVTEDFVTADVLDLLISSECLLAEVIEAVTHMGLVFNPKFYLSLDDWHLDHAQDVFAGLGELF